MINGGCLKNAKILVSFDNKMNDDENFISMLLDLSSLTSIEEIANTRQDDDQTSTSDHKAMSRKEINNLLKNIPQPKEYQKLNDLNISDDDFTTNTTELLDSLNKINSELECQHEIPQNENKNIEIPSPESNTGAIRYEKSIHNSITDLISLPEASIVIIPEGTYEESIVIKKPIRIIGEGKVIILTKTNFECILCSTIDGYIENIQFINEYTDTNSCAAISNFGQMKIVNCQFTCKSGRSVIAKGSSNNSFLKCQFLDGRGNLLSTDCSCSIFKQCTFENSSTTGIILEKISYSSFIECMINNNKEDGVYVTGNAGVLLQNCTISDNGKDGIKIDSYNESIVMRSNKILHHIHGKGILILGRGKLALSNNEIFENENSITVAQESVIISFSNTIQKGSIVGKCEKKPLIELIDKSRFYSDQDSFSENDFLSIRLNHSSIFEGNGISLANVLSGICVFTGTKLVLTNSFIDNICDNGIYCMNGSSIDIKNSTISNCRKKAIEFNGSIEGKVYGTVISTSTRALFIHDTLSEFCFEKCKIIDNKSGIMVHDGSNIIFEQCTFGSSDPIRNLALIPEQSVSIVRTDAAQNETKPRFYNCDFLDSITNVSISKGTCPVFNKCIFTQAKKSCIGIQSAQPTFEHCIIKNNDVPYAVTIVDGSNVKIKGSIIQANSEIGMIVKGENIVELDDCEICSHTKNTGIVIMEGAKVKFTSCHFTNNLNYHLDIRSKSDVTIEKCHLSSSGNGKGVFIHENAKVEINNSKIHDESTVGIWISGGGTATITGSEFYNCTNRAIFIDDENSTLSLSSSDVHDNTPDGLVAKLGQINVKGNIFRNHSGHGILYKIADDKVGKQIKGVVLLNSDLDSSNTFENNKVSNISTFQ